MSIKLKIDFHIHTAEDIAEIVACRTGLIPAKNFIDLAVKNNYDAISFTHHGILLNDPLIFEYAKEQGILLIPGVEAFINKMHVLMINYSKSIFINTFEDLKKHKNEELLIIAPHPYYMASICLGSYLEKHIELFDAIEYCHYYYKIFNLNRKALRIAKKYNKPIIGNSDAHHPMQFGTTYSYIHAEEKSIPAIFSAIRNGKIEYVSHPQSFINFAKETKWLLEKVPYELQMEARKILLHSSRKIFKKIITYINDK